MKSTEELRELSMAYRASGIGQTKSAAKNAGEGTTRADAKAHEHPVSGLSIDRISFRYREGLPLLFDELCIDIGAGQMTAIVGPAGSGKTTLIQILCGLYAPQSGQVRYGGLGLKDALSNGIPAIGVVPRQPMLFAGSVLANLNMADPSADLDDMLRVCRLANLQLHPDAGDAVGEDTVGEHGAFLSVADRQSVAIARALLKRPHALVLDDSFADLSPKCCRRLVKTVNGLKGMVTLILAARRLPSGLDLDMVVRLGSEGAMKLSVIPGTASTTEASGAAKKEAMSNANRAIQ